MFFILFVILFASSQAQESLILTKAYKTPQCDGFSFQGFGFLNNRCIEMVTDFFLKNENYGEGYIEKSRCDSTCSRCQNERRIPYKCNSFQNTSLLQSFDKVPELKPTGFTAKIYIKNDKCEGEFDALNFFGEETCVKTRESKTPFYIFGSEISMKMTWKNELGGLEVIKYKNTTGCEGEILRKEVWRNGQCVRERSGPTVIYLKIGK